MKHSSRPPRRGTQQQPQYRYNESMINWEQLKNFGLSREELQERGLLDQMLKGYKTNQVVPISMNFGSAVLRTDARLSFQQSRSGDIVLGIHGIRQKPDLDRPYFGHIFSDEDKKNLLETGNMGRVVELKNRNGEYVPSFVSIDKLTNEVVAMKAENVFIPREISGVKLTEQEQNDLREGKKIFIEGMTDQIGQPVRRPHPGQCRAQGRGVHLRERQALQPAVPGRRGTDQEADRRPERGQGHLRGGHEAQGRGTVLLLREARRGDRPPVLHPLQPRLP